MKRRTFINTATVLGASFCTGIAASAQILQPTLMPSVSLHLKDFRSQILQNSSDLNLQNRYGLVEELLTIKEIVREEYKGKDYVFSFKNYSGNLVEFSQYKGIVKTVMS